MLFATSYRCPLDSASERKLLMPEPLTAMDPRYSSPNAVATGWEEASTSHCGPIQRHSSSP